MRFQELFKYFATQKEAVKDLTLQQLIQYKNLYLREQDFFNAFVVFLRINDSYIQKNREIDTQLKYEIAYVTEVFLGEFYINSNPLEITKENYDSLCEHYKLREEFKGNFTLFKEYVTNTFSQLIDIYKQKYPIFYQQLGMKGHFDSIERMRSIIANPNDKLISKHDLTNIEDILSSLETDITIQKNCFNHSIDERRNNEALYWMTKILNNKACTLSEMSEIRGKILFGYKKTEDNPDKETLIKFISDKIEDLTLSERRTELLNEEEAFFEKSSSPIPITEQLREKLRISGNNNYIDIDDDGRIIAFPRSDDEEDLNQEVLIRTSVSEPPTAKTKEATARFLKKPSTDLDKSTSL